MTNEQLNVLAKAITDALIGIGADMRLAAVDLATIAAVAAVNINVRVHGPPGIEHMRNAADAAELQLLEETAVS